MLSFIDNNPAWPQYFHCDYSRHQLDQEDEDAKINHKMHLQVRRMMSEKRQKKKIVKTPSCEPDIQVMSVKFNSKLILIGVSNHRD